MDLIKDLYVLRIIVDDVFDTYRTLGLVHELFIPLRGETKDYIGSPKHNGYQSIHTVVKISKDYFLEIQIRTKEMEDQAKYGIFRNEAGNKITWMKDLSKIKNNSKFMDKFSKILDELKNKDYIVK